MMTSEGSVPEQIQAWPELLKAVDEGQGVYPTNIALLRQIEGAGRTGPKLLEVIDDRLRDMGLGHLPADLPTRADERVVLYRRGTHFGEMVRAIQEGVGGSAGDSLIDTARRVNRIADAGPVVPVASVREAFNDLESLLGGGGKDVVS